MFDWFTWLWTWFADGLGREVLFRTYQHIYLTVIALAIAIAIALPLGVILARTRFRGLAQGVLAAAGVIQTVPTLALIAFVVAIFAAMQKAGWIDLPAIGVFPGIVALTLYALLPILRNTFTGIQQVDASVIEVARGMGMKPSQILTTVELPLALPVIMAGVRISTVWTIGIAALAGLIGAGGTGAIIMRGLQMVNIKLLLAGTIPAAALAVLFDWLLGRMEIWLTPSGMRQSQQ
ncbi:MAG: ABC transporter permease [Phycisphaerae bacterium]